MALLSLATGSPHELEERAGDICQAGIYSEIVSVLKSHSPAKVFCSKAYPPACTLSANKLKVRIATTTTQPTTKVGSATLNAALTTTKIAGQDSKSVALSKLVQRGKGIISTVCSCIQSHNVRIIRNQNHIWQYSAVHDLNNYNYYSYNYNYHSYNSRSMNRIKPYWHLYRQPRSLLPPRQAPFRPAAREVPFPFLISSWPFPSSNLPTFNIRLTYGTF